jgi:hypothetical protein
MTIRLISDGRDPVVLCHGLDPVHDAALRTALAAPDFAPYDPFVWATAVASSDWASALATSGAPPADNIVLVGVRAGCDGVMRALAGFEARPRPIRGVVLVDCATPRAAWRFWVDRARADAMRFAVVYDGCDRAAARAARRITGMRLPDDCVPMGACDEGELIAEAWDGPVDVARAIAKHAMRCARSTL